MSWREKLTERQLTEIEWCKTYARRSGRDLPRHAHILMISELAGLLDEVKNERD